MSVVLGTEGYRYEVDDRWAKLPPGCEGRRGLFRQLGTPLPRQGRALAARSPEPAKAGKGELMHGVL